MMTTCRRHWLLRLATTMQAAAAAAEAAAAAGSVTMWAPIGYNSLPESIDCLMSGLGIYVHL
jgi:hypothetical protein